MPIMIMIPVGLAIIICLDVTRLMVVHLMNRKWNVLKLLVIVAIVLYSMDSLNYVLIKSTVHIIYFKNIVFLQAEYLCKLVTALYKTDLKLFAKIMMIAYIILLLTNVMI